MEKILVADDDPALRGLIRLVARRAGFDVDVATNGKDALDKICENDYTIAVIDLMMPLLSGYEVVERLSGMSKRPAVIVVTAMADTYIRRLDGEVVQSIVRKPFDIEMLRAVLTELAEALKQRRKPQNVVDIREHLG